MPKTRLANGSIVEVSEEEGLRLAREKMAEDARKPSPLLAAAIRSLNENVLRDWPDPPVTESEPQRLPFQRGPEEEAAHDERFLRRLQQAAELQGRKAR